MGRENTDKISVRQKIAISLIMLALQILNPTGYTHEIKNVKEAMDDLLRKDSDEPR